MIITANTGMCFTVGSSHTFEAFDILGNIKDGLISRRGRVKLLKYISKTYPGVSAKISRIRVFGIYLNAYNLRLFFDTEITRAVFFYKFYFGLIDKRMTLVDWSNRSTDVNIAMHIHPSMENAVKFCNFITSRAGKIITEKRIINFLKTIDSDCSVIKVKITKDYSYFHTVDTTLGPTTVIARHWQGSYLSIWFGENDGEMAYIEVSVAILPKQYAERLSASTRLVINKNAITAIYNPRIVYPNPTRSTN